MITRFILFSSLFTLQSCTKTEVKPTAGEQKASLLAGPSGSAKNWLITSGTMTTGSVPSQIAFDACFLDNVYQFTNNSSQDFMETEGLLVCTTGDPALVEKGNWALSFDGSELLVEGNSYNVQAGLFIAYYASYKVTELTATALQIQFNVVNGSTTTNYTYSFAAQK